MTRRFGRAAALLGACMMLGAASKAKVVANDIQTYHPNLGPRGVRKHGVGGLLIKRPVVWARAAVLAQDLLVVAGEDRGLMSAGKPLPEVVLTGVTGKTDRLVAYCTPLELTQVDEAVGFMVGALGRALMRSGSDGQFCVSDIDGDGRFDRSFELNDGTSEARKPKAIAPVPYEVRRGMPVSARDDHVGIRFTGASAKQLSFTIEVTQRGGETSFSSIAALEYSSQKVVRIKTAGGWPRRAHVYGAEFDITAYDPATMVITIDWSIDAVDVEVPVPTRKRYYPSFVYY